MGFLDEFFDNKRISSSTEQENEHAVIIYFNYGIEGMEKIYELGDKLKDIIEENSLGKYDGHEIAMDYSDGSLYMCQMENPCDVNLIISTCFHW